MQFSRRLLHWPIALALLGNLALILSWPLWAGAQLRGQADPLYGGLCHRQPERCYEIAGEPLPVCARCLGVWLGALLAATAAGAGLLGLSRRTLIRAGLLVAAMIVSWLLGQVLFPAGWHLERTISGILGGLGLYLLLWGFAWTTVRLALAMPRAILGHTPGRVQGR
jgi:uncharacterized membrane protein